MLVPLAQHAASSFPIFGNHIQPVYLNNWLMSPVPYLLYITQEFWEDSECSLEGQEGQCQAQGRGREIAGAPGRQEGKEKDTGLHRKVNTKKG